MLDSSRTICVIPARGGSKRVPGKNLTMVAGKPLIVHTIDHALAAQAVGRVIVSTDSEEIADAAAQRGSEVVRRPIAISGDQASSEDAILHVLDELDRNEGFTPDLIVFLQCTSPVRRSGDIDAAVKLLLSENMDSVFSVVEWKAFLWSKIEGRLTPLSYDAQRRPRSQELRPFLVENGSIYVMRTAAFLAEQNRLCGRYTPFVMDGLSMVDVDRPEDLEVAELHLRKLGSGFRTQEDA